METERVNVAASEEECGCEDWESRISSQSNLFDFFFLLCAHIMLTYKKYLRVHSCFNK